MKNSLLMQQVVGFSLVAIVGVVSVTGLAFWHMDQIGEHMKTLDLDAVAPMKELLRMERAVNAQQILVTQASAGGDSSRAARSLTAAKKLQKEAEDILAGYEKTGTIPAHAGTQRLLRQVGAYEDQTRREQQAVGRLKVDLRDLDAAVDAILSGQAAARSVSPLERGERGVAELSEAVRTGIATLQTLQFEQIEHAVAEGERVVKRIKWQLALAGVLVIGLAILFAIYLGGKFTGPIRGAVASIAAAARQQQATAREIATTTAEIGATSSEISATSKELSRTMNEVSTVAERSAQLAGSGQASLAQMGETMRHVGEAAATINAKLAALSEKAANINQVVVTIAKVADQTNLLSLNAAIEAEKAGEYGRGFSVVASEIRRLADQTAEATGDIEKIVKEIQSAVSAGVMGMDKFSEEVRRGMHDVQQVGGQLSQIIEQVQTQAGRFESVNEGMQAQAGAAEEISQTLMQLSESAQQTVESLEQLNLAVADLSEVANGSRGASSPAMSPA